MSIKKHYRKVWEEYNKRTIPKGYHIHHIDGNHENDDPSNLMCVSAEEHFMLHLLRGDQVALYGKFIQGASDAEKKGGSKSKPRWNEGDKKKNLSISLKESYKKRGGSPLKGRTVSEETRKKMSEASVGEKNAMYGKTHTLEVKKKLSDIGKKLTGEKNPFYGKKHSKKTKEMLSQNAKERVGVLNGMYGRSAVKEQNLKWYTNGIDTIYVSEGTQPEGFQRGRKLKKKE